MRLHAPDWASGERGRFLRASAIGAVVAVLLFAWLGAHGRLDLFEWQRSGNFYDAQAESWLDGTWQVSGGILGIERFESHGGTYMYQGPWPALLRMPVVAVTDAYDGRLSLLSMLVGVIVAAAATTRLHWRIRRLVRGDAPVTRGDLWIAAAATLAVCGGSALLYEASRPWVYHEATVWGAAWSIAAIDATVGCVTRPSRRRFLWAALTTTLALTSRGSVGLAGTAALAILCGGNILGRLRAAQPSPTAGWPDGCAVRSLSGTSDSSGRLPVLAPGLAAAAPVAVLRRHQLDQVPHVLLDPVLGAGLHDPRLQAPGVPRRQRRDALRSEVRAHHVRAVRAPGRSLLTRTYPFVDFPAKATPIGGVEFDLIDYSSSVPSTMPALTVLAIVGAIVMFRPWRRTPGTGLSACAAPRSGPWRGRS